MDAHDVGVRQRLQMLKFAAQLVEQFGPVQHDAVQNFDGEPGARLRTLDAEAIDGLEHRAHATLAEHSHQFIAFT